MTQIGPLRRLTDIVTAESLRFPTSIQTGDIVAADITARGGCWPSTPLHQGVMYRQGCASSHNPIPTRSHGLDRVKPPGSNDPQSRRPINRQQRLSLCLRRMAQQPAGGDGEEHSPSADKIQSEDTSLASLEAKVRVAKLQNVAVGRLRRRSSMRSAMNFAVALRGDPEDEKEKSDKLVMLALTTLKCRGGGESGEGTFIQSGGMVGCRHACWVESMPPTVAIPLSASFAGASVQMDDCNNQTMPLCAKSPDCALHLSEFPRQAPKEKKDKDEAAKEDVRSAIAATAFAVAVGATVLRVGGRAALLSVAGLDFMQDSGLKDQVDQAIAYADDLGSLKLVVFAGAWCLTKVACLDAIGIVLAISSGILFGGVWQGGAISAACATLGSAAAFGLGRTVLRDRVAPQVMSLHRSMRRLSRCFIVSVDLALGRVAPGWG